MGRPRHLLDSSFFPSSFLFFSFLLFEWWVGRYIGRRESFQLKYCLEKNGFYTHIRVQKVYCSLLVGFVCGGLSMELILSQVL